MSTVFYKVQLCKLCIDTVVERSKTTWHNYDIIHINFGFQNGFYTFGKMNKNTGIYVEMVCSTINKSTHRKAFFFFFTFLTPTTLVPSDVVTPVAWVTLGEFTQFDCNWKYKFASVSHRQLCPSLTTCLRCGMCFSLNMHLTPISPPPPLIYVIYLHPIKHRWYILSLWVSSGVQAYWCSVPESWSS